MDRKQALEKLEKTFEEEKQRTRQEYEEILTSSWEQIATLLYEGISRLDKEYPIQILQFQIMRADLYQNRCQITVCGYDKDWYLDEKRTDSKVDIRFLYEPFLRLQERMEATISVYMGAVTMYDIQNMVCEFFIECFRKIADLARGTFYAFDEWAEKEGFHLPVPFRIVWGAYRDMVETIFYMDFTGKTEVDLEKECEEENKRGRIAHFHRAFVESTITNFHKAEEKFAFLTMKRSVIEQTSFTKCMFAGCNFEASKMNWCSFEGSSLAGCNFSKTEGYQINFKDTDIQNCMIEDIKLRKADFTGAKLKDVTFTQGMLEECSFRNAVLYNVDLRLQVCTGVDFTGAKLDNVYILEKDVDNVVLSEEQKEHVFVISDEEGVLS